MDETITLYKININRCTDKLNKINTDVSKKNIDDALDYLLDKNTYNDIKKNVNRLAILHQDRMMLHKIPYCSIIIDFTEPRIRKLNSIIKMYGSTLSKLININKDLTKTCYGDDSHVFLLSMFNAFNGISSDILTNEEKLPTSQCPICPACDDMYLKILYRNICFTVVSVVMVVILVMVVLFRIKLRYRF